MQLIILSSPTDLEYEHETIHALFESGLKCLHLRKPEKTKEELEAFLKKIASKHYRKIVVHSCYSLIERYNLKGVHLPEKVLKEEGLEEMISIARRRGLSVSTSLHTIEEIYHSKRFDYVFLSPVFDSISKTGYKASIDLAAFASAKKEKGFPTSVIALGGVHAGNAEDLILSGFDGVAILGSVWGEHKDQRIAGFEIIRSMGAFSK